MQSYFQTLSAWHVSKASFISFMFLLPWTASAADKPDAVLSAFLGMAAKPMGAFKASVCSIDITTKKMQPPVAAQQTINAYFLSPSALNTIVVNTFHFPDKTYHTAYSKTLAAIGSAMKIAPIQFENFEPEKRANVPAAINPTDKIFTRKIHHMLTAFLASKPSATALHPYLLTTFKPELALLTYQTHSRPVISDIINPPLVQAILKHNEIVPARFTANAQQIEVKAKQHPIRTADTQTMPAPPFIGSQKPALKNMAANQPSVKSSLPPALPANLPANLADTLNLPDKITLDNNMAAPNLSVPEYVIIRPSDRVTFSSETSASVLKINVKEGTTFNKNDVLLVLDCRVQQADLQKALAQQQATHMALMSAKRLRSYGSISTYEYTQALSQDEIANAEVDKLRAVVEKCTVKAPFKGAVADLLVHEFETVKPGDPLLKIVGTENLDFELQVPSVWLKWLHIGSIFYVHINELDQTVRVRVTKINPQIDSVSQTVRLVGSLDEVNEKLLPGMSGQASFPDNPNNFNYQKAKS